jgi:hypothetical protein
MIRNLGCLIVAGLLATDCSAQGTPGSTAKEKVGALWERATKAIGGKLELPSRKVARGAKPEIVLSNGRLYFDGKELIFDAPIAEWRAIIGKGGSCSPPSEVPAWCKWDQLGLEILATLKKPQSAVEFTLYFARDQDTESESAANRAPWRAYGVFPGYFALDATGIDAKSPFNDIKRLSPAYHLKCGLMSCENPRGAYGEKLKLFFSLAGNDEHDPVREITLSSE